ncbi:MAG TPA: cell division protein FtsL [Candidatus Nitrosotenuis sp.]|nr:cell division protein FtsL [Candidatus Nitrosotenuis sp.]
MPTRPAAAPFRRAQLVPWPVPLAGFIVCCILLLACLCQFAQMVSNQYRLIALKETREQLLREQAELRLKVQQLSSLERIEQIAAGRLKMVRPQSRQVLDLVHWAGRRPALASSHSGASP